MNLLVHIPNRNVRVLQRNLTRTEIDMLEHNAPSLELGDATAEICVAADMTRVPAVFARNGEIFASSRDVSAFFEKRHDNVMRDIGGLLKSEETLALRHLTPSTWIDKQNGQSYRSYDMTRDGFTLLAMGFTGAKALKWKLKYIEAFNIMEAELRARPAPVTREQFMAQAILLAGETIKEQVAQIAILAPKAEALDRIAAAEGSLSITEAAKALQVRPKDLFAFLSSNGWIYRRAGSGTWLGYQTRTNAGDMAHNVNTIMTPDGTERIVEQVKVTPRGLAKLAKLMVGRLALVS